MIIYLEYNNDLLIIWEYLGLFGIIRLNVGLLRFIDEIIQKKELFIIINTYLFGKKPL